MSTKNPSSDNPLQESVEAMGERANEARHAMSDMARTAAEKVDESREAAANGLESAASTVRDRADQVPGGPRVKEFARGAADRLSTTADYIRSHDATRVMADVEDLVKNNPGAALVVAATFGFLLARALSRD